jgi:hypothetical protein
MPLRWMKGVTVLDKPERVITSAEYDALILTRNVVRQLECELPAVKALPNAKTIVRAIEQAIHGAKAEHQ